METTSILGYWAYGIWAAIALWLLLGFMSNAANGLGFVTEPTTGFRPVRGVLYGLLSWVGALFLLLVLVNPSQVQSETFRQRHIKWLHPADKIIAIGLIPALLIYFAIIYFKTRA